MRFFTKPILAAVLAVTTIGAATAAPAFADQRYGNGYEQRYNDHDRRNDRDFRNDRDWRGDRNDRDWNRGYNTHFRRGDRFDFRRTHYVVVNDWRRYHAPAPRYGQYYVRADNGDLLLVAAATGLVLWALSN